MLCMLTPLFVIDVANTVMGLSQAASDSLSRKKKVAHTVRVMVTVKELAAHV